MGDMLSTATSGLLAFQRALNTTSHNIANVNTEGYSRQRVIIGTRDADSYSTGFIGNGANVQTVERIYDEFIALQSRTTAGSLARLAVFESQASGLNNLFGDSETGLTASLQRFVNSFQDVSTSPGSIPARQVVLSQAQALTDRMQTYDARLSQISRGLNEQLAAEADAITALARNIAELNQRIEVDQARTGQPPNDLLDQRALLIDKLATHVNVNVGTQNNGSLIVSIGSGQPLVVGREFATLTASIDPFDAERRVLTIESFGVSVDVTGRLSGGTLGGQLDFQRDMLDPARNALGRMTIALAEVVNQQQRAGIDLNGNFGQDLFTVGDVQVLDRLTNTGTSALTVTRQQPGSAGSLTGADYILEFDGAWSLRRTDTGMPVTLSGAGTIASPFVADGIEIVVSGTPAVGDSHAIRPTRAAVQGFSVAIANPNEIAAAAPISTATSSANVGSARVSAGLVLDATDPQLQTPVSIQFVTATTYSIDGGAPVAYTPGANIDYNGWRIQISGTPAVGDEFTVGPNANPAGDNRNALLLSEAISRPVLNNGTVSLTSDVGRFVSGIGVATNQARTNRDAQLAIHNANTAAREAVSGVNLDEEAANLLRYQQAYQAAAQIIAIANTLFDSVLQATRR